MGTADKLVQVIEAKTANHTIVKEDFGKLFTNRGATGAVTFTLPAVVPGFKSCYVEFYTLEAQDVTIAGTAGELVTFNDAAANSVAFSTAGDEIGNYAKAICDGTSWLIILGIEGAVVATVAT